MNLSGTRNVRHEIMLGLALAIAVALIVFAFNRQVAGPMIQPDEGSYLANAAAIAGYENDFAGSYQSGYSFILAPAYMLADTPQTIWKAVKAINAVLIVLTTAAVWFLSRYICPDAGRMTRISSVVLVSFYPMWVVMAGYAFSQIAVVPVYLMALLACARAVHGNERSWIVGGFLAGFLYWLHPTGMIAVAGISAAVVYYSWAARRYRCLAGYFIAIAVMVAVYRYGITPWLVDRMTISGLASHLHYPGVFRLFSPLFSTDGIMIIIARLGGHLFYLTIGTAGFIWTGMYLLGKGTSGWLKRDERISDTVMLRRVVLIAALLSLAGTILASVLMFSASMSPEYQRFDHWMYGRYVEAMIAPILLAGALLPDFKRVIMGVPVVIVSALLLSTQLNQPSEYENIAWFNISALVKDLVESYQNIWVLAVVGCVYLIILSIVKRTVGAVIVLSVFIVASHQHMDWHRFNAENLVANLSAAAVIREKYEPGACIGFDHSGIDGYGRHKFWWDYGFLLYDYRMKRMTLDEWVDRCDGPLFSYDEDIDRNIRDVYVVDRTSRGGPVLYAKGSNFEPYPVDVMESSPSLFRILGSGWHEYEGTHVWSGREAELLLPVPLLCEAHRCSVSIQLNVFGASETRPVTVAIRNASTPDPAESAGSTGPVIKTLIVREQNIREVMIPLSSSGAYMNIIIEVPEALSPKELGRSADHRTLGVALRRIELRRQED